MTIKLTPDAPRELNCKVYPLSKDERELLQKWILEEEELGRIYEGPSPLHGTSLLHQQERQFGEKNHHGLPTAEQVHSQRQQPPAQYTVHTGKTARQITLL
jgi:hypothetical protein